MASIYRPTYRTKSGEKKTSTIWRGRVLKDGREYTRSLDTSSRAVAKERLAEWLEELQARGWRDRKKHKFEDAALRFVQEHFPRIKPSSAKRYAVSLVALRPHLDGLPIDKIGSAELSAFEQSRRAAGVSDGTIRRDLSCLAALYRCAEEWEWHTGNPAAAYLRAAQRRGLNEAPARTRYLSHEEEQTILGHVQAKCEDATTAKSRHAAWMLYAAIALSIDTGLRREELFGLPWEDVDLDGRQITVQAKRAKSARQRSVPLLPRSLDLLRALPRAGRFVLYPLGGERYADLPQQLEKVSSHLGMTDLRWHDLRRTCGCRLIQDYGMDIKRVSVWLGHSSVAQTERAYAFLDVRHLHAHIDSSLTPRLIASAR